MAGKTHIYVFNLYRIAVRIQNDFIMNKFYNFNLYRRGSISPKQIIRCSKVCIDLKRLTMLCFLFVSFQILSDNTVWAQCTISPDNDNGSPTTAAPVGNSFTACQNGILSKLRVLSADTGSSYSLTIYEGNGTSGTVLGTKTGVSLTAAISYISYSEIDFSSENISLTDGNQYTFYFTTPVRLYYFSPSNISGGDMYQNQGSGAILITNNDVRFELDIEGPSNTNPIISIDNSTIAYRKYCFITN